MQAGSPSNYRLPVLILLLGSITAIGPISIDLYLPAFPELTDAFDAGPARIQLTLTACVVGLAVGQLLNGPLSDTFGRRRPLLVGMTVYVGASILCALSTSAEVLTAFRLLQGLAGAAGAVITQALVRDLVDGVAMTRVLSRLVLVMGVVPVLAPTVGSELLVLGGWRGLFWMLAGFGAAMTIVIALFVGETLPPARRRTGGVADVLRSYRRLLRDLPFLGCVGINACGFTAIFGYVSGSPFAYQELYGLSPRTYGLMFGLNSIGMVIGSQLNARLVLNVSPGRVLSRAVVVALGAGLALLITSSTGWFGLVGLAAPLFVLLSMTGLILPNSGSIALHRHPESAGAAAALLGAMQFLVGAFAGPLIGLGGSGTAVPMAVVILVGTCGMVVLSRVLRLNSPHSLASITT